VYFRNLPGQWVNPVLMFLIDPEKVVWIVLLFISVIDRSFRGRSFDRSTPHPSELT